MTRDELFFKPKSVYETATEAKVKEIYDFAEGYKTWLDASRTERLAVREAVKLAEKAGFKPWVPGKAHKAGEKLYFVNREKALTLAVLVFGEISPKTAANYYSESISLRVAGIIWFLMWLLTPERDYRVELFSAYTISAYDETYTIFRGFGGEEKGPELEEYLKKMKGRSAVECDVEFDPEGLYLVLSTCAYSFEDARSVVHGKMVPVNSAGGKRLTNPTPATPAPTTP